jgi:hypothetical protein
VDVEKARKHFDQRAARERLVSRARGVPLVAGYYVGALAVAGAAAVLIVRAVCGG